MPTETNKDLVGFCSAPWTDCITYSDGALKACDRNVRSFGDWQKLGLKNAWESLEFQNFRQAIREGRYPDQDCASCHNNGTQRTALSSLVGAYSIHYNYLKKFLAQEDIPELGSLYRLLYRKKADSESASLIPVYLAKLESLRFEYPEAYAQDSDFHNALVKLKVVGEALEDYLAGELKPRRVATFRQSQLQAKCTARCVMCVGLYTGEIVSGPTMDSKYVDEAFAEPEDITDFWCNGAEYLFYKEWKKIALTLAKGGTKLRVSTNGILLTEPTIDFILDNRALGFLTMSLDGATKETMESTRVRVNYDRNVERIRYLLRTATEKGQYFEFTAAFVMMKRNLHELPAFVRLIKSLMPENCLPRVTVLCQPLENFSVESYRRFVHGEHHALLGEQALREIFQEVNRVSVETGVSVAFYNQKLPDFMAQGMPFPKYFPRQMDVDIFLADLRARKPLWNSLDFQELIQRSYFGRNYLQLLFLEFLQATLASNEVIAQTRREFPDFDSAIERELPGYAADFLSRFEEEKLNFRTGTRSVTAKRYLFRAFRAGDYVYSASSGTSGRISKIVAGLVLLHDGKIVPLSRGLYLVETVTEDQQVLPIPASPRDPRGIVKLCLGRGYLYAHPVKERLFRGRKSPLLWKLSVVYRRALGAFGVETESTIRQQH